MTRLPLRPLATGLLAVTSLVLGSFATPALAEGTSGTSGTTGATKAQIFIIDGTYYGCVPGSQTNGVNLSKCTKLPQNVIDLLKANGTQVTQLSSTPSTSTGSGTGTTTTGTTTTTTTTGSSTGTSTTTTPTTKPGDDSESGDSDTPMVVASTSSGNLSCPMSAFTSDKKLDPTLCTASTKKEGKVVCSADTTTTASGTTTTNSALLVCAMPGGLQSQKPLPKLPDSQCPGGGTRQVVGGYDPATGKIDITITFTACKDENGGIHDGTALMQGTLMAQSGSTTTYDMDETKTVNSTIAFPNGNSVVRACTVNRKGSYNMTNGAFHGTVTRNNCSLTGDYRFKADLLHDLTENATEMEPI